MMFHATGWLWSLAGQGVLLGLLAFTRPAEAFPVSAAAWSEAQWEQRCKDVQTSYNQTAPLPTDRFTLKPDDPRFLDFLYWVWANKILEHQIEQVGGTEWKGPSGGVIFHWAPGSRWETHTLVSFDHAIQHIAGEHRWQDNMFKEFFEPFGPVKGVNIGDRLSMETPPGPRGCPITTCRINQSIRKRSSAKFKAFDLAA